MTTSIHKTVTKRWNTHTHVPWLQMKRSINQSNVLLFHKSSCYGVAPSHHLSRRLKAKVHLSRSTSSSPLSSGFFFLWSSRRPPDFSSTCVGTYIRVTIFLGFPMLWLKVLLSALLHINPHNVTFQRHLQYLASLASHSSCIRAATLWPICSPFNPVCFSTAKCITAPVCLFHRKKVLCSGAHETYCNSRVELLLLFIIYKHKTI